MMSVRRHERLWNLLVLCVAGLLGPFSARSGDQDAAPRVGVSIAVIDLVKEQPPDTFDLGEYYEVCRSSLSTTPIVLYIGVGLERKIRDVPLTFGPRRWIDLLEINVERDGAVIRECELRAIPGIEAGISEQEGWTADWTKARRRPEQLNRGETVVAFFEFVCGPGTDVPEGIYRLSVGFENDASRLFGMELFRSRDVVFRVKECEPHTNRAVEDRIERHYLWAMWLYKFDRPASKVEFLKAWDLVWEYVRRGAGDEPGLWNITPRYQAAQIRGWLDDPSSEISYLSQMLSKNAGPDECRMRYYHFGRERGHLPRNVHGDLALELNNRYEAFYGKAMNGRAVQARRPWPKKFADSPDPTLKIDESLPKNPE